MRYNTDVGRGLGSESVAHFIPKVSDRIEVRAPYRPVTFFHLKLGKPFFDGPGFVRRGIVMLKQERDKHKLLEGENTLLSKISLYIVTLRLLELRGLLGVGNN